MGQGNLSGDTPQPRRDTPKIGYCGRCQGRTRPFEEPVWGADNKTRICLGCGHIESYCKCRPPDWRGGMVP